MIYFDQVMRLPWNRLPHKMGVASNKGAASQDEATNMKELCHKMRLLHPTRMQHSNMRLSHSTRIYSNISDDCFTLHIQGIAFSP